MTEFLGRIYSWLAFIPKITLGNLFEILIISFLIYEILIWVQNTRAWVLLKGGLMILAFYLGASLLRLNTITWMINHMGQLALIALLIIFQPELRKALEQLGSKNIITDLFISENSRQQEGYTEKTVNEITRAAFEMGKVKTGALIVVEQAIRLTEYESTGIQMDCLVSSQVLENIFEHNTPLHDGAIIIRGDRIVSATCYLPLSDNMRISKDLGTRHRAAVGMSEVSDALIIAVSEETGAVSVAQGGKLARNINEAQLRIKLKEIQHRSSETNRIRAMWKGWREHAKKNN